MHLSRKIPYFTIMLVKIDHLFNKYYRGLVVFTYEIILDIEEASDIVQTLFADLWEKYEFEDEKEARNFLFLSARNRALNHLRHLKIRNQYIEHTLSEYESEQNEQQIDYSLYDEDEIKCLIEEQICKMPPQMQTVFRLRYYDELSTKEVAEKLNISDRTAEKHYEKAIKFLRKELIVANRSIFLILFL